MGLIRCGSCGGEIDEGNNFCPNCGCKTQQGNTNISNEPIQQGDSALNNNVPAYNGNGAPQYYNNGAPAYNGNSAPQYYSNGAPVYNGSSAPQYYSNGAPAYNGNSAPQYYSNGAPAYNGNSAPQYGATYDVPPKKNKLIIIGIVVAGACVLAFIAILIAMKFAPQNDAKFLANLEAGLDDRWDHSDKDESSFTNEEYRDYLNELVEMELKQLGAFEDYSFEDEKLKALAKQYFAALDSQLEGAQYYGINDTMYASLFLENGYRTRLKIISMISDLYGLTVSYANTSTLKEMIANGTLFIQMDAIYNMFSSNSIVIESLGGNDYELIIENTTEYSFTGIWFYFNLFDDNGIVVDTAYSYLETWNSGSKNKVTVYTNQKFTSVEMQIRFYDFSGNLVETDYKPINYVNEMGCEITCSDLFKEINYYGYGNSLYTTCIVSRFDYSESNWSDGKVKIKINFSGKKSFDIKGSSYSRSCRIGWKLYDENGRVVSSGTVSTTAIKAGETFIDCYCYTDYIEPGVYRLELLSVS